MESEVVKFEQAVFEVAAGFEVAESGRAVFVLVRY